MNDSQPIGTPGDDEQIAYLPFNAINEFMTHDYRLEVVRMTLLSMGKMPRKHASTLTHLIRRYVTIPGFRNSIKAPISLKVKPLAREFEKDPEITAAVLSIWAEANPDLRLQVFDLLTALSWDLLPPDADRAQLPGFQTTWPAGQDFDSIYKAFQDRVPDHPAEQNDVSLMAVWLSGCLPLQVEDQSNTEATN